MKMITSHFRKVVLFVFLTVGVFSCKDDSPLNHEKQKSFVSSDTFSSHKSVDSAVGKKAATKADNPPWAGCYDVIDYEIGFYYVPGPGTNCQIAIENYVKNYLGNLGYQFMGSTIRYFHKSNTANHEEVFDNLASYIDNGSANSGGCMFSDAILRRLNAVTICPDESGGGSGTTGFYQINIGIKPCNFNFQPAQGVNWQAAAVTGYKVKVMTGLNSAPILLTEFNVEVGMLSFSEFLNRSISSNEAKQLSSDAFAAAIKKANGKYVLNNLTANAIAGFVKTEMEYYINNELGANLARVSTQVGTNPGAGVKQWDPNCK